MKIVVTGSRGQLAHEIIAQAEALGNAVTPLSRTDLDISDFSSVSSAVSQSAPDVIINCAAFNDVDGAETDWEAAFLSNGVGVKNLATASERAGAVLVHFSSDYVFNGHTDRPYTVADVPDPISSYGQSKLLGEENLAASASRYFLIRTSWVFGNGAHSFPLKVLQWASSKRELRIVDDQEASPTYCVDLARAALKLINTGRFGIYHVTNTGHCSRYGWAAYILEQRGWDGVLVPAKSSEFHLPALRPAFSVLDNFPLASTIGEEMPHWKDATDRFLKELK